MGSDREQGAHFHGRSSFEWLQFPAFRDFWQELCHSCPVSPGPPTKGNTLWEWTLYPTLLSACMAGASSGAFQTFQEPFFHPQRSFVEPALIIPG